MFSLGVIKKLQKKTEQENLEKFDSHIVHDSNYDYNNEEDLSKYRNTRISLSSVFKNFSKDYERILRYKNPNMTELYTLHELNIRRKLHTLNHTKNRSNLSAGQKLGKIYTNKNLKHPTYSSQQSGKTTIFNSKSLEQKGNSLIFKGQALNKVVTKKLHSSNGNQTFTFDPSHPLTGINKKYTHSTVQKHPLSKIKMSIL